MEFLFFALGLLSGAVIILTTVLVLAIKISSKTDKGDNQKCTNQKQQ